LLSGKLDEDRNGRNTFITLIRERGSSYIEYKKLSKCKISDSVKCECPFCVRGFFFLLMVIRALKLVTYHIGKKKVRENARWIAKLWISKTMMGKR